MVDATKSPQDSIKITLIDDSNVINYRDEDKTLLNCLENHNIEVHYHCRDGFCGACRIKLEKGQVLYPNGEPLAFVGDKEILPCCCIPVTDVTLNLEE